MHNLYKLIGFIDLFDIIPNFVYPVFEKEGRWFFQHGHQDRVEEFVEVKQSVFSRLIPVNEWEEDKIIIDITSNPIYAFREDADKIEYGDSYFFQKYFKYYTTRDVLLQKKIEDFLGEIPKRQTKLLIYPPKKPFFYGTGRRKHSVARVRVYPGSGKITINNRDIDDYFRLDTLKLIARQPLALTGTTEKFDIICTVAGGGVTGQAGAIRHGLSRALLQYSEELRPVLKKAGFLTRDPRMKERKKYSLKAARRAPQFSKR